MLLRKGTRFATCYGFVLIAAMLLAVLLSSGQASLRINPTGGATMASSGAYGVSHEGDDILMGHPALQKYMPANGEADEILKRIIAAGSDPSTNFKNYPIQYRAAPDGQHDNVSEQRTTEL